MGRWVSAILAAAALTAAPVFAQPAPPTPQAVAPGVWLIPGGLRPNRQPDGNTVVFDTGKTLVVMDTGRHAWQRQAILDFAATRGEPIAAIVNSHWHLDHLSGNPDLRRAYPRLKVYASGAIDQALTGFLPASAADGRTYLTGGKLPPDTLEDLTNDLATIDNGAALKPDVRIGKSQAVRFGGLSLRINLAPDAATAGDLWVFDPKSRVVATGDLITLPAAFLDTACPDGWRAALARIEATPFEVAIPGHGPPMTRAQVHTYRLAFEALIDCAKSDQPRTACADGWVRDLGPLLAPGEVPAARGMSGYYVQDVLRAHGGASANCKARRG